MTTRPLLACVLVPVLAVPAFAGGLTPAPADPAITPLVTMPRPATADRSGIYAGIQLGFATLEDDGADGSGADQSGAAIGVQAGYLRDLGVFVLGAELAYAATTLAGDDGGGVDLSTGRLLARAGYDAGALLPYVTGGFASGELDFGDGDTVDLDAVVYGMGVDLAITDRVALGAEYLRHDIDRNDDNAAGANNFPFVDTLSLRASYRF